MSVVAVPAMLAPILGPTLGGLILDNTTLALDLLRQPADRRDGDAGGDSLGLPNVERKPSDALDYVGPGADGNRLAAVHLRPGRDRRRRAGFTSTKVVVR